MSLFLNIPLEVRELIIGHATDSPLSPPMAHHELQGIEYKDLKYKAWCWRGTHVYYTQHGIPTTPNCLPLLLTNHQISTETRMVLKRKKINYLLDISVKNELDLFLTWLSVPCLTPYVSTLYANVRLWGHIMEKKNIRGQLGDGGRLGFHWSFYAALERFLRYGPVGGKLSKEEVGSSGNHWNRKEFAGQGILIDTLILNFQSAELELNFPPEDITDKHWLDRHWGRDRGDKSETLSSYKTRPEWLCRYLEGWIAGLLCMTYHTSKYGQPLYEHIGTIRMLVDGRPYSEFDLAARLARLRFTDSLSTMGHLPTNMRESEFWKWKKETLLRREAQGLPVIWPSDDGLGR